MEGGVFPPDGGALGNTQAQEEVVPFWTWSFQGLNSSNLIVPAPQNSVAEAAPLPTKDISRPSSDNEPLPPEPPAQIYIAASSGSPTPPSEARSPLQHAHVNPASAETPSTGSTAGPFTAGTQQAPPERTPEEAPLVGGASPRSASDWQQPPAESSRPLPQPTGSKDAQRGQAAVELDGVSLHVDEPSRHYAERRDREARDRLDTGCSDWTVVEDRRTAADGPSASVAPPACATVPPSATFAADGDADAADFHDAGEAWPTDCLLSPHRFLTMYANHALTKYVDSAVIRRPGISSACGILVVVLVCVALPFLSLEIETDFTVFMKTDVPVSTMRDAFLEAYSKRAEQGSRRLQSYSLIDQKELRLAFEVLSGNIFEPEVLMQISEMEQSLRAHSAFKSVCDETWEAERRFCNPGLTFSSYAMPESYTEVGNVVPSFLNITGRGTQPIPLSAAISATDSHSVTDIFLPAEFDPDTSNTAQVLRSAFRFNFELCGGYDPVAVCDERKAYLDDLWGTAINELRDFLSDEIVPEAHARPVNVWYEGSNVEEAEVLATLFEDVSIAGFSLAFVLAYLIAHTRSIFVSLMGIIIIFLSIPFSVVIVAVLAGITKLSVAFFLSVFLIIGLGSDVVFVYTDFWRDSSRRKETEKERIMWSYAQAGRSSFATSFTTAISFFANLASVLKPLREFGFFMGVCVMTVWVLMFLIFLPVLVFDERRCQRCRCRSRQPSAPRVTHDLHGPADTGRVRCFSVYARRVHSCQKMCCCGPSLIAVVMLIWAAASIKVDTGVPNIFPADHNQNRGKEVFAEFVSIEQAFPPLMDVKPSSIEMCNEYDFDSYESNRCVIFWCEVEEDTGPMQDGHCDCHRSYREEDSNCAITATAYVTQRFITTEPLTNEQVTGPIADFVTSSPGLSFVGTPSNSMHSEPLAPMLLLEWETGATELENMAEIRMTLFRSGFSASCGWNDVCFCGTSVCRVPRGEESSWSQAPGSLSLSGSRRLQRGRAAGKQASAAGLPGAVVPAPKPARVLASSSGGQFLGRRANTPAIGIPPKPSPPHWALPPGSRRMQLSVSQGTVPLSKRSEVEVAFGLEVDDTSPLLGTRDLTEAWSFLPSYDMSQAWAQRNLYSFCTDLPGRLLVTTATCWIVEFKEWLGANARFPVPMHDFHGLAESFVTTAAIGELAASEYVWMRDNRMKASFFKFSIDIANDADSSTALDCMREWDKHLARFNENAAVFVQGAFHVSSLWVRAEAQSALIASTTMTLAIALFLAFVGMLVFTGDCTLSLYVVLSTTGVICGLLWFILVLMGWAIGPIEVIALIVFVGYAVTYSLHIAHKYGSPLALNELIPQSVTGKAAVRYQRTAFALKAIGGAALGSACTTAGSSIFLLFCTLTIFGKLGGVVLAVTLMSIFSALLPLPSALFVAGPTRPGCMKSVKPWEVADALGQALNDPNRLVDDCLNKCWSVLPKMPAAKKKPATTAAADTPSRDAPADAPASTGADSFSGKPVSGTPDGLGAGDAGGGGGGVGGGGGGSGGGGRGFEERTASFGGMPSITETEEVDSPLQGAVPSPLIGAVPSSQVIHTVSGKRGPGVVPHVPINQPQQQPPQFPEYVHTHTGRSLKSNTAGPRPRSETGHASIQTGCASVMDEVGPGPSLRPFSAQPSVATGNGSVMDESGCFSAKRPSVGAPCVRQPSLDLDNGRYPGRLQSRPRSSDPGRR